MQERIAYHPYQIYTQRCVVRGVSRVAVYSTAVIFGYGYVAHWMQSLVVEWEVTLE